MSKGTGLACLVLAWLLLGAALLLVGAWGTASKAEVQAGRIVVDPTRLTVSEPSGSGEFTLTLSREPVATVFVDLSVSNEQCTVAPASVSLDAANWDTGAIATVTAVDDSIADGAQNCFVVTAPARSDDPNYDGVNPRDVKVTVNDDDEPGILVVPTTLTVSEPFGSDIFIVTLASEPVGTVSIPLSASNEQCTVSPSSISLDAGNWSAGVAATVTAVDDAVNDGTQICSIQTGPSTSDDPNYVGLNPEDVTVAVLDDDKFIVVVDPTSLTISEPAGSRSFNLALTEEPTATVSVPLSPSNSQCAVSPSSVDLDAANWASGVTAIVTAVDDFIADGTQTCLVETGPAASDDPRYDGHNPQDVTVTVYDNDEPGILVDPTRLTIGEPSGSDTFVVALTSQPISAVSVSLSASNSQCTVSPGSVDLDADNWASGVTATVTAVDDSTADGTQTCLVETGSATSDDPDYHGRDPDDVIVTVYDDDEVNILVVPTALSISEPSGTDSFSLTLGAQPAAPVFVDLTATSSQCTVSPAWIGLNSANWSSGVTATVTAVDDPLIDGPQTCLIETGPATSDDPEYDGRNPEDVIVTVYDDDEPGVLVVPTALTVSEPSGSGIFTLTLISQPAAKLSIDLSASNSQCTVWPASVNLEPADWSTGVSATVTAVDDLIQDGTQTCLVQTEPAFSADPNYAGLDPDDVMVTVLDDDVPGVIVIPTSLTISEPSGSDVFTVSLTGQPMATVSIPLSPANSQCTVAPISVDLDAANWYAGVAATVTAVDDSVRDGTQECLVRTGLTDSADPDYDGLDPKDVSVMVHDDEMSLIYLPSIVRNWPPLPGVPTLYAIENPEGLRTYTIDWSSAPNADDYVLEEARDRAFSDADQIYVGTSTSHTVSGRMTGRYYYRVKSRNAWAESGWSAVRSADVRWEVEPNDEIPQANGPIVSGLIYYGTFPGAVDEKDYFFFELAASHRVQLWLTNIPAGRDYDLVLRRGDATVVAYSPKGGNADEYLDVSGLPPASYYVQVYRRSGAGSSQPYHLRVVYE